MSEVPEHYHWLLFLWLCICCGTCEPSATKETVIKMESQIQLLEARIEVLENTP